MFDTFGNGLKELVGAVASPRITAALAAVFGVLWFLGGGPMSELGLPTAAHSLTGIFALALLAAWAVQVLANLWSAAQKAWRVWHRRRKAIRYLDSLSPKEKELMVLCARNNQQSLKMPQTIGEGHALVAKGILIAAPRGHVFEQSYTIDDYVWKHLQKNRETFLELWDR